jgi:hypothetical protein
LMLLSVNTSEKPSVVKADESLSVLFDAVILAKALRELYEDVMWDIVAGRGLDGDAAICGTQVPGQYTCAAAQSRR